MKSKGNTLIAFLSHSGVKHTTQFTNKIYNEHPERDSLFGLSKMLNEYHITNQAIKIENTPENILSLPTPFVAYLGSEFAVVYQTSTDGINYIQDNKQFSQSPDAFCSMWSGTVLMAEPDENSIEPEYALHRKKELIDLCKKVLFICSLFVLFFTTLIRNTEWTHSTAYWVQLLINAAGVYISWLLVLKQLHIQNWQGDKICSIFRQKGCNEVLDLDVAKPGGIIGWSEIGLGYFVTNLLVSLYFPSLIPYTVVLNYFCLPYTFWSIWYQKYKARQWCMLCVLIQMLLWGLFFVNLYLYQPTFLTLHIPDGLIVCLFYLIMILFTNWSTAIIGESKKSIQTTYELNQIKSDKEIFFFLLKKEPFYNIEKEVSTIRFGNPEGNIMITILSNPHCKACAELHKNIEKIVNTSDNVCIQYIFTPFNQDLVISNLFLIGSYLNSSQTDAHALFSKWFREDVQGKKKLLKNNPINLKDQRITNEFSNHQKWVQESGITSTPTLLVNGYKLPSIYTIEEIERFFLVSN